MAPTMHPPKRKVTPPFWNKWNYVFESQAWWWWWWWWCVCVHTHTTIEIITNGELEVTELRGWECLKVFGITPSFTW